MQIQSSTSLFSTVLKLKLAIKVLVSNAASEGCEVSLPGGRSPTETVVFRVPWHSSDITFAPLTLYSSSACSQAIPEAADSPLRCPLPASCSQQDVGVMPPAGLTRPEPPIWSVLLLFLLLPYLVSTFLLLTHHIMLSLESSLCLFSLLSLDRINVTRGICALLDTGSPKEI